jgi:hypothetical protein
MAEELDPGFLAISISDDDDSAAEAAEPKQARIPGTARTGQSEEDFQAVRRTYRVKIENGEVSLPYPLLFPVPISYTPGLGLCTSLPFVYLPAFPLFFHMPDSPT